MLRSAPASLLMMASSAPSATADDCSDRLANLSLAPTPLRQANAAAPPWLVPLPADFAVTLAKRFERLMDEARVRVDQSERHQNVLYSVSGHFDEFSRTIKTVSKLRKRLLEDEPGTEVCLKLFHKMNEMCIYANERLTTAVLTRDPTMRQEAAAVLRCRLLSKQRSWRNAPLWLVDLDQVRGDQAALESMQQHCLCVICGNTPTLQDGELSSKVKHVRLKCQHVYHLPCLLEHLKSTSVTCPLCKDVIFADEPAADAEDGSESSQQGFVAAGFIP